jgi:CDP-paratose synthetase
MHILVTGATGHIGSELIKNCLSNDFKISAIKRLNSDLKKLDLFINKIDWYDNNSTELKKLFESKNKVDAVVHAATNYGRKYCSINEVIESNINFPIRLLESAVEYGVEKFINLDSFFSAGAHSGSYLNAYSLSKKHFLEYADVIALKKIKLINMRLHHVYGTNDNQEKFIPKIIIELIKNKPQINLTHGQQTRDFIYIDDVISAVRTILHDENIKKGTSNFDVGTGVSYRIEDFVRLLHRNLNSGSKLEFGKLQMEFDEIIDAKANIAPLKELGWGPKISLEMGLKLVINGMKFRE